MLTAGCAKKPPTRVKLVEPPKPDYSAVLETVRTPYKHPELVLSASYQSGTFDSLAVDCPFVFAHEGRYLMTYVGFDGTGYRTGLAESTDLINWTKRGLLLDRGPAGSVTEYNVALTWILRDNDLFGPGAPRKINGRYHGTYHAYPGAGYETGPAVIGLCWSEDLFNWVLNPPFLTASDPGAGLWEQGGLYKSCLVEHEGKFYLFYNAKNRETPWREQIGFVTSDDMKMWTRELGNPLIPTGNVGSVDDRFCSDPCVLRLPNGLWAMFFFTLSSDGFARESVAFSKDLIHWDKSGEKLIDVGAPGSIDSRYAHKPSMFAKDGVLYHYYCAVAPATEKRRGDVDVSEIRGITVATSKLL